MSGIAQEHQEALKRMRAAHFDWVRRTRDLGLLPEQDMRDRARGSSEYEMARDDARPLPVDRIFSAAVVSGQGAGAVPELLKRLDDADAAVRFWAVIGLTNTAARDEPAAKALQKALADSSVEVRIVAAEALCRIDRQDAALPDWPPGWSTAPTQTKARNCGTSRPGPRSPRIR